MDTEASTWATFMQIPACLLLSNGGGQLFINLTLKTYLDTCRPRPATLIYATKKSLRALDSSANWTQKGGWYPGYQNSKCSRGGNAVWCPGYEVEMTLNVDDYLHFFFYFLTNQNSQRFNEDVLVVNASSFTFVLSLTRGMISRGSLRWNLEMQMMFGDGQNTIMW